MLDISPEKVLDFFKADGVRTLIVPECSNVVLQDNTKLHLRQEP